MSLALSSQRQAHCELIASFAFLVPVKYETVVFCKTSPFQEALYRHFIKSPEIKKLLRGVGSQPLKAINILKKLCNHPDLLDLPKDLEGCEDLLPEGYLQEKTKGGYRGKIVHAEYGGKFLVLERCVCFFLEEDLPQYSR